MWWESVVQGRPPRAVGGFAGVRSAGATAVAETPLGVPQTDVCGGVVRRTGPVGGAGTGLVNLSRRSLGHRAGGASGRTVAEVAAELGCDWHTVNSEVTRWGGALLEADTARFGEVEAVGVDETLFWREGRWRKKRWCTSVVDVGGCQLLDIVPGRTVESAASWFRNQSPEWCENIRWAVLDMSGPYQVAYDQVLPHADQVADPFHVVRLANRLC